MLYKRLTFPSRLHSCMPSSWPCSKVLSCRPLFALPPLVSCLLPRVRYLDNFSDSSAIVPIGNICPFILAFKSFVAYVILWMGMDCSPACAYMPGSKFWFRGPSISTTRTLDSALITLLYSSTNYQNKVIEVPHNESGSIKIHDMFSCSPPPKI